jgi:hypothetical protein
MAAAYANLEMGVRIEMPGDWIVVHPAGDIIAFCPARLKEDDPQSLPCVMLWLHRWIRGEAAGSLDFFVADTIRRRVGWGQPDIEVGVWHSRPTRTTDWTDGVRWNISQFVDMTTHCLEIGYGARPDFGTPFEVMRLVKVAPLGEGHSSFAASSTSAMK